MFGLFHLIDTLLDVILNASKFSGGAGITITKKVYKNFSFTIFYINGNNLPLLKLLMVKLSVILPKTFFENNVK